LLRSPVRKNCMPGSVWGMFGNRHSYHNVRQEKLGAFVKVKVLKRQDIVRLPLPSVAGM
jgi:hypothetical protein